jgi:hypothetical protein
MFHAINAWLARLLRQILEIGLERDNTFAVAHGWHAQQIKPGTWAYRDPRFIHRKFRHTYGSTGCPWCDSKVAEWLYDVGHFNTRTQAVQLGRWS